MLFNLLKVAEILGTSNIVLGPTVPTTTVMSRSSPSVLTSPTVLEYMKTLSPRRASPIKSPLSRYKRLKQSPLKNSSRARVNLLGPVPKPVVVSVPGHSPASSLSPSSLTTPIGGSSMRTSRRSLDRPLPLPTSGTSPQGNLSLPPFTSPVAPSNLPRAGTSTSPDDFSLVRHNARINRDRERQPTTKPHHLVTVSKKALKHSGSFSQLQLADILYSVATNLQAAQSKSVELMPEEAPPTGPVHAEATPTSSTSIVPTVQSPIALVNPKSSQQPLSASDTDTSSIVPVALPVSVSTAPPTTPPICNVHTVSFSGPLTTLTESPNGQGRPPVGPPVGQGGPPVVGGGPEVPSPLELLQSRVALSSQTLKQDAITELPTPVSNM